MLNKNFGKNHSSDINQPEDNSQKQKKGFFAWVREKMLIKEISSENNFHFNFKNSNWFLTILYLSTFIIIPIIYSFVKTYGFKIDSLNNTPEKWQEYDIIFTTLIPFLGIIIALILDWKTMLKKGAWAAYSHFLFGFISALVFGLVFINTGILKNDPKDPFYLAVSFLLQIVFQFIGSILVLISYRPLRKQIFSTLKEAKADLLFWVLIFFIIGTVLTFMFNAISSTFQTNVITKNSNSSDNQQTLELMTKTPLGIFAFILGTIFIAPINEEISYRFGTFAITKTKWLGFTASLIYFPAMHILQAGDWQDILGYLSMAVVLPSLFVNSRGNTTYTIGLHMFWNLIAACSFFIFNR